MLPARTWVFVRVLMKISVLFRIVKANCFVCFGCGDYNFLFKLFLILFRINQILFLSLNQFHTFLKQNNIQTDNDWHLNRKSQSCYLNTYASNWNQSKKPHIELHKHSIAVSWLQHFDRKMRVEEWTGWPIGRRHRNKCDGGKSLFERLRTKSWYPSINETSRTIAVGRTLEN